MKLLQRVMRTVCPPNDRGWVDALFAELEAVEPGKARALWLFGAMQLVLDRYMRFGAGLITPTALGCLIATLASGALALSEYEGLAIEDDWYPAIAAVSAACLACTTLLNLKKHRSAAVKRA